MFAAIEWLTVTIHTCKWIHRLYSIVAVNARLRGDRTLQPIPVIVSIVAGERAYSPTVDRPAEIGNTIFDLSGALFHAQANLQLGFGRKALEVDGLSRSYADIYELGPYLFFILLCGTELKREVEVFEEVPLQQFLVDFREVDARCRRGADTFK